LVFGNYVKAYNVAGMIKAKADAAAAAALVAGAGSPELAM